ncbi:hypothetical protein EDB83DRAFT_2313866 [Lactarius deliciosus]|nr:hypothetical protein EDB83DRAFT_2313866 [Lactarius deliciosus]
MCKQGSGPEWPGRRNAMRNWIRRSPPGRTERVSGHQKSARLGRSHVTETETWQWNQEGGPGHGVRQVDGRPQQAKCPYGGNQKVEAGLTVSEKEGNGVGVGEVCISQGRADDGEVGGNGIGRRNGSSRRGQARSLREEASLDPYTNGFSTGKVAMVGGKDMTIGGTVSDGLRATERRKREKKMRQTDGKTPDEYYVSVLSPTRLGWFPFPLPRLRQHALPELDP